MSTVRIERIESIGNGLGKISVTSGAIPVHQTLIGDWDELAKLEQGRSYPFIFGDALPEEAPEPAPQPAPLTQGQVLAAEQTQAAAGTGEHGSDEE